MSSCFGGPTYRHSNQATQSPRSMSRRSAVPSYLSRDSATIPSAHDGNTSYATLEQPRRRSSARRTLIEVLNEALELLGDDGVSDFGSVDAPH
ncbi:hypothetical protein FisN_15Lh011 [Fistulifera solaris]|uniref:Uncharacterized protein n=1 Tax=Fistulifera solaris TaxID=1519565 RepID=A0A1Z5KHD5_FISSO|nr:hypothetical protein FisN_15Lh011 [Fistulifera solaris]|eukprot:GAX25646.1 hypothetical protein FisN_15Lh011 [Fistulifera solaris]